MKNTFVTAGIIILVTSSAFATTWTVDDDGMADFNNIQAAVDAAIDGDEIIVMPGTYTSTQDGHVVNMLGKAVTLRSSDPSDPDVVATTIIDGENQRRGIVCFNGETEMTLVKGLTITNGYESDDGGGGGIQCNAASPTISYCIFSNNEAHSGAAIFSSGGNTVVSDCKINNNYSRWDGGGFSAGESGPPTSLSFLNCEFISNNSSMHSGAIAIRNETNFVYCESCLFQGNWTSGGFGGGAIRCYLGGTINLIDCSFLSNNATSTNGGGLRVDSGGTATLGDCYFCANSPEDIYGPWTNNGNNIFSDAPCFDDCNENGIDDLEDIANQTSFDCDQNSVPDECQPDCDGDGWIDACDNDSDVDGDGIPDNCEPDCNANSLPDDYEIQIGIAQDCNLNGIPDECDISTDPLLDCDGNGAIDSCEIASNPALDCNNNGLLDACELVDQVPAGAVQWTVEDGGNGHWYRFDWVQNTDSWGVCWQVARDLALAEGGDLVSITSQEESDFIYSVICPYASKANGNLGWLGLTLNQEGNPIWSTGEDVNFTNWENGQPSGDGPHAAFSGDCGLWNDIGGSGGCHNSGNGIPLAMWITEWSPQTEDCNSNGILDECEIASDPSLDCNDNGVMDECELYGNSPEGAVQWTVEEGGNGHWYQIVYVGPNLTWQEASDTAVAMGGYLATPTTVNENNWLFDNLVDNTEYWSCGYGPFIGGVQDIDSPDYSEPSGAWTWISGEPWEYSHWKESAPDNCCGGQQHLMYGSVENNPPSATWNDVYLNDLNNCFTSFVVEFNYLPDSIDCNSNSLPDECDISDGTSNDVNLNGIPDECETDCNANGVPDLWEIKTGQTQDCNANTVPDDCDITSGFSADMNSNGVPDECEPDCNGNGIPDAWDIKTGASIDCNGNGIPDSCDVADGCVSDCNLNGVPDVCDIADGTSDDINVNNVPDECECIADITGDGTVNIHDLLALIGYWGSQGPLGDFNADGIVKIHDLLILIAGWGECTNVPCGPPMAGAVQWPIEEGGNGHWYFVVNTVFSWQEGFNHASTLGGYLVTFTTAEEQNFVLNVLSVTTEVWLGGYQNLNSPEYSEPAGGWEWVTGEPFTNFGWVPPSPANNGDEHFLEWTPSWGGGWNDLHGSATRPVIIEWSD